jgi:hypothetical protein
VCAWLSRDGADDAGGGIGAVLRVVGAKLAVARARRVLCDALVALCVEEEQACEDAAVQHAAQYACELGATRTRTHTRFHAHTTHARTPHLHTHTALTAALACAAAADWAQQADAQLAPWQLALMAPPLHAVPSSPLPSSSSGGGGVGVPSLQLCEYSINPYDAHAMMMAQPYGAQQQYYPQLAGAHA